MSRAKRIRIGIFILQALVIGAMLLKYAPWVPRPADIRWYYLLILLFYLLLLAYNMVAQLQKNWRVKYKSYLDNNNILKKKLILPGAQDIKEALTASVATTGFIITLIAGAALFYLNYLLVFCPVTFAALPGLLLGYDAQGQVEKNSIWLVVNSFCVLLMCAVVISQNHHLKLHNRLSSRQNLIVNAHSSIALANLSILFTDINKMFLGANKMEYILNAKPPANISQPGGQALLNLLVGINLQNDYSVTEFYIRQLSVFVDDMVLECDNYHSKFHQIFAIDNDFVLSFYIKFTDTDVQKLERCFVDAEKIKMYYSLVVKNSFGVITDIYGSVTYGKNAEKTINGLHYTVQAAKNNQYFYM